MTQKKEIISYLKMNKELFYKQYSVVKLGIFGSFARDEQTDKSDIDILIDMPKGTENIFEKRMKLKETISNHFSLPVDVCHERALKPYFRNLILKEVIYV